MFKCSAIVIAALLAAVQTGTAAAAYPERPIRMIVPFAPGGGSDISARTMSEALGQALGTTIVVDNRPGAGSSLGTDIATKSSPDGYTTLLGNISMAFNAALYKKLPYVALRDLAPISLATEQPNILVAHPSLPASNFSGRVPRAPSKPLKRSRASGDRVREVLAR